MFSKILPSFARKPLLIMAVAHFVTFYGAKALSVFFNTRYLSLPADELIPFCPPFVIVYILAFVFWIVNIILAVRISEKKCRFVFKTILFNDLISFLFFVFMPTTMERPEITQSGLFPWIVSVVYYFDTPLNLFPSMHCSLSWLCWRFIAKEESIPKRYRSFSLVFAILICASTVLVKQHVAVDIISGLAAAELSILLAKLISEKETVKKR